MGATTSWAWVLICGFTNVNHKTTSSRISASTASTAFQNHFGKIATWIIDPSSAIGGWPSDVANTAKGLVLLAPRQKALAGVTLSVANCAVPGATVSCAGTNSKRVVASGSTPSRSTVMGA